MTTDEIVAVIANIQYKPGFALHLKPHDPALGERSRLYLQVGHVVQDVVDRTWRGHSGRKWTLTEHMTVNELIQTAFKAFLTFEEHECREAFTYCGQKVLGPHLDLEQLAVLLEDGLISESTRGAV